MFNAFLHGGGRQISTSWSWGESFYKLCMTQNAHIVVVEYRTYNCIACTRNDPRVMWHVKRSSKDRKHQGIPMMGRWVVSPVLTKTRVCVTTCESVKCRQNVTNVISFSLQLIIIFFLHSRCLLLPALVSNRIMCAKFCMKWRRRMKTSFFLGIWWKWLTGQCEGIWKWFSCLASWCVDPWSKCALPTPLLALS